MATQDPELHEVDEGSNTGHILIPTASETKLYADLSSPSHIRVMILATESVSDTTFLRCNFVEQDLHEVVPWDGYNALSYCWGSSPERVAIICNGHELSITRNLYNALIQIWKITPKQLLWADAICINQEDDVEKGLQVGMMGKIYQTATTVLVWLGEDEDSIASSWRAIQRRAFHSDWKERRDFEDKAFEGFLTHPWFTRTWTLQEVLLARKAVLLCGTRWIDWRLITETIGPKGPLEALRRCTEIMQSDQHRERRNLFKELLIVSSTRDATNPRDRIYALLGLMTRNTFQIRPDYRMSYWQLIADFVRDQVRSHSDLWFLHACGTSLRSTRQFSRHELQESHGEKPSWLPDLLDPVLLKLISERHIFPAFSGSFLRQDHFEQPFDGLLRVRGSIIGLFSKGSRADGDSCSLGPLPSCVIEAMSQIGRRDTVQLSFKGLVRSSLSHSHRYLDRISLFSGPIPISYSSRAAIFGQRWDNHLSRRCSCSQNLWSSFSKMKLSSDQSSCLMSPNSYHPNIRTGDLLCVLAKKDGCFALRPSQSRSGTFQLVGSAFAPTLGQADAGTEHSFQWPIPANIMLFDIS